MTHAEHVPFPTPAAHAPATGPITAAPGALHFEHGGRVLEVRGSAVRVIAYLGQIGHVPTSAGHTDLPAKLRTTVNGPVLDHTRLNLSSLQVEAVRTSLVSLSMIAQAVCSGREVAGLSYDQAMTLLRAHLNDRGYPDLAASIPATAAAWSFRHGELAALMRCPRLAGFPWWARTYDVATGRVKLLPGDEQYGEHLTAVLALREVLSGEALERAEPLALRMDSGHSMLRREVLARLATPLRLLLAARGEGALLDVLANSTRVEYAAESAVSLIREDLAAGGAAHDRLQVAAHTLVSNPSRRPVLISGGVADLYLFTGGARLLLPGSAESLEIMKRGESHLITHTTDFQNAAPDFKVQDLEIRPGHLHLRASRDRLQDGTVHHDDRAFTLESQKGGTHRLSILNLLKPGRAPKVRTVQLNWTEWPDTVGLLPDLSNAEKLKYLNGTDDDLPF